MPARILVAEDDRKQADFIRGFLEREGHATVVAYDGVAALEEVRRRAPDLVVLDLMLPRLDGLAVCRKVRAGLDIPIIMLTARSSEDDLLLGLTLGADDYITKPYSSRELVARVQAVLRRSVRAAPAETYAMGELSVDLARHQIRVAGTPIETTPAEFALLACLAAAPGRVFTRDLLLDQIGIGRDVTGRTIDVHVMNLRRKIEPVPNRPRYLLTVYGVGYKLVEEWSDAPDGS